MTPAAAAILRSTGGAVIARPALEEQLEVLLDGPSFGIVVGHLKRYTALKAAGIESANTEIVANPEALTLLVVTTATALHMADEIARLTAALDRVTEELAEARARAEQVAL